MILRILSLLLTPIDYAAAVYLVARGVMLAPDTDPPQWLRDFERAPRRNVCDGCLCDLGSCASWCPRTRPTVTCDGCGAGMGEDCAAACRFVEPLPDEASPRPMSPPVVACCYCGKVAGENLSFTRPSEPLCEACYDDPTNHRAIGKKLASDRAQAAVAPRAEEAGGLAKAPDLDAVKALPRCGMPACPISGCQR